MRNTKCMYCTIGKPTNIDWSLVYKSIKIWNERERERVNTLENVVRKLLSSMVNLHVHRTFDDGAITMSRRHHSEAKMFNWMCIENERQNNNWTKWVWVRFVYHPSLIISNVTVSFSLTPPKLFNTYWMRNKIIT